jgi:hypothetical protein
VKSEEEVVAMHNVICILCLVAVGLILSGVLERDKAEEFEQEHYCHMTRLFKETKGEFGWPEYKGPCEQQKEGK